MRGTCRSNRQTRARDFGLEPLEKRAMLSAVAGDAMPADQPVIEMKNGVLTIIGTELDEEVNLVVDIGGENEVGVTYNGQWFYFVRSDIRAVDIDMRGGNDYAEIRNGVLLEVPMTINGGAGNDYLYQQRPRDYMDRYMVKKRGEPGHAPVTLIGGEGNDSLWCGVGETLAIGGTGRDCIIGEGWLVTPVDELYPPDPTAYPMTWDDPRREESNPAPEPQPEPQPVPEPEPAPVSESEPSPGPLVAPMMIEWCPIPSGEWGDEPWF